MINIENTETYGFEAAIRGMRNPLNSWSKSDSHHVRDFLVCGQHLDYTADVYGDIHDFATAVAEYQYGCDELLELSAWEENEFIFGEKDLALAKSLIKSGTDHSKFMRMITVTCDITAPLYWWKEFDAYKVGTVRNSCSTMHTIHKKKFELDDFSHEYMYTDSDGTGAPDHAEQVTENILEVIVRSLNYCREYYLETGDKRAWYNMIQLLPSSYNQRATVQMNYAVLRNIYHARKNHKLDEWHDFCKWIESLPYSELITEKEE